MSDRLQGVYLDERHGLVGPMNRYEKDTQRKTFPVTHDTGKLVSPDGKKTSVMWLEKDGKFNVTDHVEYMSFATGMRAVLCFNKDMIDKDNPNVDDQVIKHFSEQIRAFKLKNVEGYNVEKITIVSISTNAADVFSKYTLSEMVNFTHHPYAVCSVDFNLVFSYCPTSELRLNAKC